jgi:hypothetical protein
MWSILLHNKFIEVVFTQSSRKHRVGRRRAVEVMAGSKPISSLRANGVVECAWKGPDDRGLVIEVVALLVEDRMVVIHVMPTALRRRP